MSRVLMLYGTTDGHTRKIAGAVSTTLQGYGCFVDVIDARGSLRGVRAEEYLAVIVAASVHAGGFQRPVRRWVRANAAALAERPTAFLAVCLAILEHRDGPQAEIRRIVDHFLALCAWRPGMIKIVAGAMPYTRYNWFKKYFMRRIALKTGGGTDTSRDYEYTDWNDLRAFARTFASQPGLAPAPVETLEPAIIDA